MEEQMYSYRYPHPAVATDCVIFGFDGVKLKVLLVERGGEPYKGMWAFPGGFLRMDETAEQGALRELKEETDLSPYYIEQFHCFSDPHRDPRERVLSIAFLALVKIAEVKGGDDAAQAEWFSMDEIPQLAFDHDHILRMALDKLRERIHFPSARPTSSASTETSTTNSSRKVSDWNSDNRQAYENKRFFGDTKQNHGTLKFRGIRFRQQSAGVSWWRRSTHGYGQVWCRMGSRCRSHRPVLCHPHHAGRSGNHQALRG